MIRFFMVGASEQIKYDGLAFWSVRVSGGTTFPVDEAYVDFVWKSVAQQIVHK